MATCNVASFPGRPPNSCQNSRGKYSPAPNQQHGEQLMMRGYLEQQEYRDVTPNIYEKAKNWRTPKKRERREQKRMDRC